MKVLLFDTTQAYLTPGGKQKQVQMLYEHLPKVGVEVEYARWWDPDQTFDIAHFFGYRAPYLIDQVKQKNKKIVLTQVMDVHTNMSSLQKYFFGLKMKMINNYLPHQIRGKFDGSSLNKYDALVYMHKYDWLSAINMFQVNKNKTHIIPHAFNMPKNISGFSKLPGLPSKYLVSVGSIVPRKRPLLLAQYAKAAKIPVVFIGPGEESNSYYKQFKSQIDNKYVFYLGFADETTKMSALNHASGFVLLSTAESGCIAVYEAGSLGLPLLLPNMLWAKAYTDPTDLYHCDVEQSKKAVQQLAEFFDIAEKRDQPTFKIHSWTEIAEMYKEVYQKLLPPAKKILPKEEGMLV